MEDIVSDFADEATESLRAFSDALVRLEQAPGSRDLVDEMFRAVHTIKGAAGFLALPGMERVSHSTENVLALVRSGEVEVTARVGSALFAAADLLTTYVDDLRATGAEAGRDDAHVLAEMAELAQLVGEGSLDRCVDEGPAGAASPGPTVARPAGPVSVRVATAVLDSLVGSVGELVAVRNGLDRLAALRTDVELTRHARQLSAVTGAVRQVVLTARAQRVDSVWVGLDGSSATPACRPVSPRAWSPSAVTSNATGMCLTRFAIRCCTWCAMPWTTASRMLPLGVRTGRTRRVACCCAPAEWTTTCR